MKTRDLIKLLIDLGELDGEVYAWDADQQNWQPVTGVLSFGSPLRIELQTDDNT